MKQMSLLLLSLFLGGSAGAHVPALLPPLPGAPISSYFLGQSDLSRAVYSELTEADDLFVAQFEAKGGNATLIQLLTPVCEAIPQYEAFQPSALLIKGDLPWKQQGETNKAFVQRLEKNAMAVVSSRFPPGKRPKFYENFGKQNYWVGGELRKKLKPGLYAVVVFNSAPTKGTFTLGLNEREAWTPDLYKYVSDVMPSIKQGICSPTGFTGKLKL